jgi:hypothetical protein
MSRKIKLFMKIFKAELEDLSEDILSVENKYKEKMECQDFGNFVCLENEAFLVNEAECISLITKRLEALDVPEFDTVETLAETIIRDVHDLVRKYGYPAGIERLIARKIVKVKSYLMSLTD